MTTDVHIRLMVTRGIKSTPYQHPRVTISGPTIVIIPEWKSPTPETAVRPLTLFTVHVRRGAADVQDPKLNSHSKLNCILACIQAAKAGADEGADAGPARLRRDLQFSVHFFIVKKGEVWTSSGRLLPGRYHPRQRAGRLPPSSWHSTARADAILA